MKTPEISDLDIFTPEVGDVWLADGGVRLRVCCIKDNSCLVKYYDCGKMGIAYIDASEIFHKIITRNGEEPERMVDRDTWLKLGGDYGDFIDIYLVTRPQLVISEVKGNVYIRLDENNKPIDMPEPKKKKYEILYKQERIPLGIDDDRTVDLESYEDNGLVHGYVYDINGHIIISRDKSLFLGKDVSEYPDSYICISHVAIIVEDE